MAAARESPRSQAPVEPDDRALLDELRQAGEWTRAVLCTLARYGVAFRNRTPQRARAILDGLSAYPPYKAGQFLFDLMEWEDYMLGGPPPLFLPQVFGPQSFQRVASMLHAIRRAIDPDAAEPAFEVEGVSAAPVAPAGELPALDASRYLYEDVVLGLWDRAIALRTGSATQSPLRGESEGRAPQRPARAGKTGARSPSKRAASRKTTKRATPARAASSRTRRR